MQCLPTIRTNVSNGKEEKEGSILAWGMPNGRLLNVHVQFEVRTHFEVAGPVSCTERHSFGNDGPTCKIDIGQVV